MSILPDLEAALDAWLEAEDAYLTYDRADIVELARRLDSKMSARSVLVSRLLTDDTIAALVAVAEAVTDYLQDTCDECATRFCEDDSDIGCSLDDMRDALAPLVKEVDDE